MKINKYIQWIIWAIPLISSCADDTLHTDGNISQGQITITIKIPDSEIITIGDTRSGGVTIQTLTLMQYDKNGNWLANIHDEGLDFTSSDKTTFTTILHKDTRTIQLVANHDIGENDNEPSEIITGTESLSYYTEGYDNPVLWGTADIGDLIPGKDRIANIDLQRQVAKLTVINKAADFIITGYGVFNMSETGTISPTIADYNAVPRRPTVPSNATGSYNSGIKKVIKDSLPAIYMFETEADTNENPKPRIIIEGIYEGQVYYYVAAFRDRKKASSDDNSYPPDTYEYNAIPVIRNHEYKLVIENVYSTGWSTVEEAITALPDNRTAVELLDETAGITNIIASHDYMLGVGNKIYADWNQNIDLMVMVNYDSRLSEDTRNDLPVTLSTNDTWIRIDATNREHNIRNTISNINIRLLPNDKSSEERSGQITVRLGNISSQVTVIQKGYPIKNMRKVSLTGLPGSSRVDNYFEWIESGCFGLMKNQNRNADRTHALIFPAVPAYQLFYVVPKETGDVVSGINLDGYSGGPGDFYFTTSGNTYEVRAKITDKPHISTGQMVITNGQRTVKYDLLQTGYFHEIKPAYTNYYRTNPLAINGVKAGWYYYEVVKIGDFYTLDRNIGASSNAAYDNTSETSETIGGYFKINTAKPSNLTNQMDNHTITDIMAMTFAKGRFIVASENELKGMGFRNGRNLGNGSISLRVTEGEVQDNIIYFPAAGYYYGSVFKNEGHVNLWTRTLFGESHGLSSKDQEYGVNYIALDIWEGIVSYFDLRMAYGSYGSINTSLMRYAPIRVVWRGLSTGDLKAPDIPDDTEP